MPKLDAVIDRLFKDAAEELIIESGAGIVLRADGQTRPLVSRKLTAPQIVQALTEIAPPQAVDGQEIGSFTYQSPQGAVEVRFELVNGNARATLSRPRGASAIELPPESDWSSGESLELASPADMLGM